VIRIQKPAVPPPLLSGRGAEATQELCAAHDAAPGRYASGELKFEFDSTIYGAASVKSARRDAQHEKCAFCESRLTHVAYGDVEHLRPKAGSVQREGDPLTRPGYYWLAYSWGNLLFSCQLCNQRFKRNLFPLKDPGKRALTHHDDLGAEEPLLLDPSDTDPAAHIGFREEVAYPVNGSPQGQATIDALGLNREELVEARRKHLLFIGLAAKARTALRMRAPTGGSSSEEGPLLADLDAWLQQAQQDTAEFASMARAALREPA
jgi:hypothetical protein